MNFVYLDLGRQEAGQVVEVTLSGSAARGLSRASQSPKHLLSIIRSTCDAVVTSLVSARVPDMADCR